MDRNCNFLKYIFILIISIGCTDQDEYKYVVWMPAKDSLSGKYILNRQLHEKISKDSTYINIKSNNTFTVRNYYFSEFGSDSIRLIPYGEGIWKIDNLNDKFSKRISLVFTGKYKIYNGIDPFNNKNNVFLHIQEVLLHQDTKKFMFIIYSGDPDHDQNTYYFKQQ